jgi:tRNA pseudouridine38-40 synthase
MIKKNENFHARHSAVNRTYKYLIINRTSPLALNINRAWHIKKKLNIKQMQSGAKLLMGTKDFSTFRASSCSAKSPIKDLSLVKIKKIKEKIEITFTSKSFLQQQVRSMVGCLKYLGEGKWTVKEFNKALLSKKRFNCAPPAPPHGLYLYKIDY